MADETNPTTPQAKPTNKVYAWIKAHALAVAAALAAAAAAIYALVEHLP